MAVETAKDKIRINQIVSQKQEIITVDGDVIVNDVKPDVLRVISTTGTLCIYKKEALNGKIKLEGCVNTYIIYLADDEEGSIRTINTSLDFAEIIDMENCKEQMTIEDNICIKGFETKILNGRKLHVKAFLNANITTSLNNDVEAIIDIKSEEEDIQMLNCRKEVMSLIGENTGKTTLKDTISINEDDELAEIMKVDFCITDVEPKMSYNKVLVKANANVRVMYLTEDNQIREVAGKIPFMGFIDMLDVTDTSECITKTELRNLLIKPNNMEEHSIYIEADIDLFCRAYQKKEINMIEDVYSMVNNLELKRSMVKASTGQFVLKDNFTVRQRLTNPELTNGRIVGVNATPVIETAQIRDNKIRYEGKINYEIMVNSDNNVNTTTTEVPFEFELSSDRIEPNSTFETIVNVVSQNIENIDDGMVLETTLEFNAIVQDNEDLYFAQDINELEPLDEDMYSMVIYFVKPGDTLWKIAKQFRSRVEDITRVNKIEDENKIYPGQQLYIPKFTKSRIAI